MNKYLNTLTNYCTIKMALKYVRINKNIKKWCFEIIDTTVIKSSKKKLQFCILKNDIKQITRLSYIIPKKLLLYCVKYSQNKTIYAILYYQFHKIKSINENLVRNIIDNYKRKDIYEYIFGLQNYKSFYFIDIFKIIQSEKTNFNEMISIILVGKTKFCNVFSDFLDIGLVLDVMNKMKINEFIELFVTQNDEINYFNNNYQLNLQNINNKSRIFLDIFNKVKYIELDPFFIQKIKESDQINTETKR